jgi:hypothetical protein
MSSEKKSVQLVCQSYYLISLISPCIKKKFDSGSKIYQICNTLHIVLLNFDVLVENAAELVIFSIPLKGGLAASLEECIPVLLLLKLFVVLWQEIHDLKRERRTL